MYIPRPAKLLFTLDDGWNTFLEKFGDSITITPWTRLCVERMLACGTTEKALVATAVHHQTASAVRARFRRAMPDGLPGTLLFCRLTADISDKTPEGQQRKHTHPRPG